MSVIVVLAVVMVLLFSMPLSAEDGEKFSKLLISIMSGLFENKPTDTADALAGEVISLRGITAMEIGVIR